jgi:uncharacterized membrane protein
MPRLIRYAALTAIFMLAALGRVINLDNESLWVDEGFSYWTLRQPNLAAAFEIILNDVHPPVYFLTLRAWSEFTGLSEFALRYFSVLPSLLTVAVVYQIARAIDRQRQSPGAYRETIAPLLAALLMALADMENYIAQETRPYTWHVLWAAVSMWMFVRWIAESDKSQAISHKSQVASDKSQDKNAQRQDETSAWHSSLLTHHSPLLWILASLLLVYTHYIGLAALAVQGLYALIVLRGRALIEAVAVLALIGGLFAPWLAVVVSGQTTNVGTGFAVSSTLASLWAWRAHWFTEQWALMIGLCVVGLAAIGSARSGRIHSGKAHRHAFLLLAWFVIPVSLTYALNWFTPVLMDYRLTQITPSVALMAAFGLAAIPAPTRTFLIAVIVIYGVTIEDTHVEREPWREIGQHAARYAVPGDLAMAHITPSGDWQVIYYFDRMMPPGVEIRSLRQWQLEQGETYAAGLPALLAEHPHVWFMHWSSDRTGFDALAQTDHVQTAVMTEDWLGNDLNVYRFDVIPPVEDALVRYDSGMVLRDAILHPDRLRIDLFWSAAEDLPAPEECVYGQICLPPTPIEGDYTVSALLLDEAGQLVAQLDSMPFDNARPTSTWQVDEVIYDPRPLALAEGIDALPPGTYIAGVKVYRWSPEGITLMLTEAGAEYFTAGTLEISGG